MELMGYLGDIHLIGGVILFVCGRSFNSIR